MGDHSIAESRNDRAGANTPATASRCKTNPIPGSLGRSGTPIVRNKPNSTPYADREIGVPKAGPACETKPISQGRAGADTGWEGRQWR